MGRLYARLWRWHFFAAMLVIPFVLWQSVTGTLYLWSERWMDAAHPHLRFVRELAAARPLDAQINAALATVSQQPQGKVTAALNAPPPANLHHASTAASRISPVVERVLIPEDSNRSTVVLLKQTNGLPSPIFVDPYKARVLGTMSSSAWIPGWTRALHGGWPLGDAGSWLLELADGWAIVMIATGLYLWWPRGRPFWAGLWPRVRSGRRVLWRDLHSCVAAWFAIVLLFFLITALPWTAFWGGKILPRIESATGQTNPAGFSPGGASLEQIAQAARSMDEAVAQARAHGVRGTLDVRLAPWPDAPLLLTNVHVLPSQDRTLVGDPATGDIRDDYRNHDLPALSRFIALGIHVHQGDFGWPNVWLNTAFAASLIWLTLSGTLSWWTRRPKRALAAPPRSNIKLTRGVLAGVLGTCIALPLLGLSVLIILSVDLVLGRWWRGPEPV